MAMIKATERKLWKCYKCSNQERKWLEVFASDGKDIQKLRHVYLTKCTKCKNYQVHQFKY